MDKSTDPNYILNPKSGRYVLKSGKIGKELLKGILDIPSNSLESLSELPDHVIIGVLKNSDIETLYNICQTDKKIKKLCNQDTDMRRKLSNFSKIAKLGVLTKEQKNELLLKYAEEGNFELVKFLIDKGADPSYKFPGSLADASAGGHLEIVKFLIENNPQIKEDILLTAMGFAAYNGHRDIVKYLRSQIVKLY